MFILIVNKVFIWCEMVFSISDTNSRSGLFMYGGLGVKRMPRIRSMAQQKVEVPRSPLFPARPLAHSSGILLVSVELMIEVDETRTR